MNAYKNQSDHDILIEVRTLVGVLTSRFDENLKVVAMLQKDVEAMKENHLKENLATRVKELEDDHEILPLKEKDLVSLIVWGVQFRSRYKLLLFIFGGLTSLVGFIIGSIIDAMRIFK